MYKSNNNKPHNNKYASYNEKKPNYQYNEYNSPNNGYGSVNNGYQNNSYDSGQSNYNNNNMYGYDEYMNYSNHASNGMQSNNSNLYDTSYMNNYGNQGYGAQNANLYGNYNGANNNSYMNNYENQSDASYNSGYSNLDNSSYNNNSYNNNLYNNSYDNSAYQKKEESTYSSTYNTDYNYTGYDMGDYDKTAYGGAKEYEKGDIDDCEITVQTPAKSHIVMEAIARLVMYIFIGLVGGHLLTGPFSAFLKKYIEDENFFGKIINVLIIIVVVLTSYFIHIVIHELGHLIGGTLSNYSLISFRVFSIVLAKQNKKMIVKKYSVSNSVGECVMMPPEVKKGKYPYKLYRIGGIAMNIVTSIVAVVLVFGMDALSKYPWNMWGVIYAVVGIITALFNGIPVVIGGVPNDGYILLHMTESKEASLAVHSQLLIHAFLSKGGSYSEVPYEQFCISKTGEIKNYLVAKVKLLEYRWHLEHLDFKQAAKCLEATNQYFNSLPKVHQYEINSEKMFVEIMSSNDKDIVEKLFNSDVERFILEYQNVLAKNRIMMAYEAGVKKNTRAAHKHYMQLKNNVKVYPIKGEADLELTLADYVYEKFCSNGRR